MNSEYADEEMFDDEGPTELIDLFKEENYTPIVATVAKYHGNDDAIGLIATALLFEVIPEEVFESACQSIGLTNEFFEEVEKMHHKGLH